MAKIKTYKEFADEIRTTTSSKSAYNNQSNINSKKNNLSTADRIINGDYQKEYEKLQLQKQQEQLQKEQQEQLKKQQEEATKKTLQAMEKQKSLSNSISNMNMSKKTLAQQQTANNVDYKKVAQQLLTQDTQGGVNASGKSTTNTSEIVTSKLSNKIVSKEDFEKQYNEKQQKKQEEWKAKNGDNSNLSFGDKLKKSANYISNLDKLKSDLEESGADVPYWVIKTLGNTGNAQQDVKSISSNFGSGLKLGILNSVDYINKSSDYNIKNSAINNVNILDSNGNWVDNDKVMQELTDEYITEDSPIRMLSKEASDFKNQTETMLSTEKQETSEKIQRNTEKTNNVVSKKLSELAPSVGQMVPGMVGGPGGAVYMTTSAGGSYYDDAISRGMNEDEAMEYSTIMGIVEGATESIQVGKTINLGKKLAGKSVSNTTRSALADFGLDVLDNFVQESLTEVISEGTAQMVGGEESADWDNIGQRMLQSGIDGALVAVIVNGASAGVGSAQSLKTKMANGEQVTQEELKQVVEDVKESGKVDVESIAKEEFQVQVDKIKEEIHQTTTEEDIAPVNRKQTIQDDIAPVNQAVQNNEQIEGLQNAIQEKQNQLKASKDERSKQIINESINQLQTELDEEISKSITQTQKVEEQKEKYKYEISENEKIDTFRQDASKYLDNSDKTQNLVNTVEKVISDKDYSIRLNDTITNKDGKSVNAQIKTLEDGTTEITINPNANNVAEFLLTHEITHSIETTEMKNLVMDYASKNSEFNKSLETLKEAYRTEEVSDEVLADVSAQLFGNQEFINELSTKKPNVFRRIYNKIIELANKITGNSKESLFIKNLKNKWEEAYRNNQDNIDKGTYYSINSNFSNEFDNWDKNNRNGNFLIGRTSEALKSIGLEDYDIVMDKSKILKIMNDHPEMTDDILKQIPNILENPTLILKSQSKDTKAQSRKVIFGEIVDTEGSPVLVALEINPIENENNIDKIYKVASAYGKENLSTIQKWINNKDNILYIDEQKNRTMNWLNGLGLQLPVPDNTSSSNNSIASSNEGVNTNKYSMQESKNNANNKVKDSKTSDIPQWQQWLEENFQSRGTRTKFEDILAPVQEKVQEEVKNTVQDIIAPIKENIQTMSEQIESLVDEIAPVRNINDNTNSTKSANNTTKESALDYIQSTFEISKEEAENLYNKIINTKNYNVKDVYEILQDLQKQEDVTIWNNEDLENISENVFNNVAKSQEDIKENNYNDFLDNIGYTKSLEKQEEPYNYYDFINNNEIKFNEKEKNIIQDLEEKLDINNKQAKNIYDKLAKKKFLIKSDVYDLLNQYKSLGEEDITTQEVRTLINNTQFDISNVNDFYKKLSTKYPFIFDNNIIQPKQQMEEITKFQNEDLRPDFYKYDDTQIRAYSEQLFNEINTIKEEKQKEDVMNFIAGLDYKDDVMNSYNKESSSTKNNKQSTLDYIVEKRTKDQVSLKEIKDTVAQRIINQGHYVDKLSERTKNPQLKYTYDRYLGSLSEAQYSIGEKQTDNKGNVVGKSITEIFKPAIKSGKYKEFNDYLLNRHNIDRMAMDKAVYGNEFTANDSKDIVFNYEKQYPEFKEWAKDVYKYNKNALKNKMEAGFISKDTYENFLAMYGSYVPTFRDIVEPNLEKVDSPQAGFSPINKATGGNSDILVIDEAMAEQVVAEKRALRLNETLKQLYHSLGEESKIVNNMPIDDPIATSLLMSDTNNFINMGENGEVTALFFEDGEITQFQINNDLYKAFDNKNTWNGKIQNNKVASKLLKPLEKITSFRRNLLTTYSIGFSLHNGIKDAQEALFNTKYSTPRFALNYGRALFEMATGGDYYKSYMANGGGANTYFEYGTGLKKEQSIPMKVITAPFKTINTLNEIIERAPRLAEYISTIQKTGDVNEAMYNASELTTNFKRGGDITKAFNKYGVNFLNASIQGLNKMYRNLTGQNGWKGYASLITRATIFAIAPSLINYLIYQDDDDYEDLPEYVTNKYWLFKTNDNKFIRIPQGRVTSILGDAATSILKVAQGKGDLKTEFFGFLDNAMEQSAPNNPISNNILSPYFQAKSNTSWYGEDIVPTRLQDIPEAEQYDEKTDEFSKWLGNQINYSPKKINYLLDQYGGGIADVLLPMSTPYAENDIIEDKFTIDAVMKNKNVGEFYDTLEKSKVQNNSAYNTEDDELKYKYLDAISKDMAELYSQKREVENSSNYTDEEKKEKAKEIQKQINKFAEKGLSTYENINRNSHYATVGNSEYYRNTKEEWEEIDKDLSKDLSSLKLSESAKNKYFKTKQNLDNISKKYSNKTNNTFFDKDSDAYKEEKARISENERQDIINKIQECGLNDKTKAYLYKKKYTSEKNIDTIVSAKIDVDDYLEYLTRTFTADKNSKGNAIKDSRKNKVISYVNKLDLTLAQKAILIKTTNTFEFNDYNKQIVQYVENLGLSQSEKKKLYKSLDMTLNNNGTVSWK